MNRISISTEESLRERVKELGCLYKITKLAAESQAIDIEDLMREVIDLIPPAWRFPECISVQIDMYGEHYGVQKIAKGTPVLEVGIKVYNKDEGCIRVACTKKEAVGKKDVFLSEEAELLNAIAIQIGIIIERRMAEDDKRSLLQGLLHTDRLATMGQLVASIAHELNEPLSGILGFAQLAQKQVGLANQTQEDLARIVDEALYAREVTKKLLVFSHETHDREQLQNLDKIIEETLWVFEKRLAKWRIQLEKNLNTGETFIYGNATQLRQVFLNLMINGVQAMPDGGTLAVSTFKQGRNCILEVKDNGTGIPSDMMKQIFRPFFTTKEAGEGTGLGLSIASGIVEMHNGRIEVTSSENVGSSFQVILPIQEPKK